MSIRFHFGLPRRVLVAAALLAFSCAASVASATVPVSGPHPRMILDSATLQTLRARANANTPQWQILQTWCDDVLPGEVYPASDARWADIPDIGSNYAGHGYINAAMNLGLCYQVTKTINPAKAAAYGAKLADVLDAISDPALFTPQRMAAGGLGTPNWDGGYGLRNYPVAMGMGYDWGYDALSPALRQQVIDAVNIWINAADNPDAPAHYAKEVVHSNYYAGYFNAKLAAALGTWGDNPQAPSMLQQWLDDFHSITLPYFNEHLAGGGWPEGFANYGLLATLNMTLPIREFETATGIDLVHPTDGTPGFAYPVDAAIYTMHFAWPARDYFDDRDTIRRPSDNVTALYTAALGLLDYYDSPLTPVMARYRMQVKQATGNNRPALPWQLFLFVNPNQRTEAVSQLPRAYLAPGMGAVAARSDWSKNANWMSFRAGPYVNNFNHAEEYLDQGSLVLVNGSTPLVVNASGWLKNFPEDGHDDASRIYADQYGSFDGTQFQGNAQLFNVYYVRKLDGAGGLAEQFGQWRITPQPEAWLGITAPRTGISAFEDSGSWVYTRASHLEDMYQQARTPNPTVDSWSREILYLRPGRFVVLDRTRMRDAGDDQYLAFHFPAPPEPMAASAGAKRIGVSYGGHFAGTATFVYPSNPSLETVPLYPDSNPVHAWQLRVRPSSNTRNQVWLSVFQLVDQPSKAATATRLNVTQGNVLGVGLFGAGANQVVVTGRGGQGSRLTSAFGYNIPAKFAHHLVFGLQPGSAWQVVASRAGDTISVNLQPGGNRHASSDGVLEFVVDAAGKPRQNDTIFVGEFEL